MEIVLIQSVLGREIAQFLIGPQRGVSEGEVIVIKRRKYLSQNNFHRELEIDLI